MGWVCKVLWDCNFESFQATLRNFQGSPPALFTRQTSSNLSFQMDTCPWTCISLHVYGDWFCLGQYRIELRNRFATLHCSLLNCPTTPRAPSTYVCKEEQTKQKATMPFPKQWQSMSVKLVPTVIFFCGITFLTLCNRLHVGRDTTPHLRVRCDYWKHLRVFGRRSDLIIKLSCGALINA